MRPCNICIVFTEKSIKVRKNHWTFQSSYSLIIRSVISDANYKTLCLNTFFYFRCKASHLYFSSIYFFLIIDFWLLNAKQNSHVNQIFTLTGLFNVIHCGSTFVFKIPDLTPFPPRPPILKWGFHI